jgi:hypothetical protein
MARAKPSIGGVTIRAKLQYKLVTSTPAATGLHAIDAITTSVVGVA